MDKNQSPFTDVDLTIEDYRPFSVLSLATFLLAVFLGLIAIVNPKLIVGSVAVSVLAGFTLIWLRPKKQRLSGYWLAAAALFISLFAASSSVAYQQFRFWHLKKASITFCDEFLELAKQGRVHELYQLTLDYNDQAKTGSSLVEKYGTLTSPGPELEMYLKQEPEISLRKDGEKAKLTVIAQAYLDPEGYKEKFVVGYKYDRPGGETRMFSIYLMRHGYDTPPGPKWFVYGIMNHSPEIPRQLTQEQQGYENMPSDM